MGWESLSYPTILPDPDQTVLFREDGGRVFSSTYRDLVSDLVNRNGAVSEVTQWMPFPAPAIHKT